MNAACLLEYLISKISKAVYSLNFTITAYDSTYSEHSIQPAA